MTLEDDVSSRLSPEADPLAGRPLLNDRYEVERKISSSHTSVLFLGRDKRLHGKRVVIKVLREEASQDEWIRRKFQQELEALSRIDHPGVVGVLDSGRTATGKEFLVTQFVDGADLRSQLTPEGMDFRRVATIIRQVAGALDAAHEAGVLHRNVKPEKIVVREISGSEFATLTGFGIAGISNSAFTGNITRVAGSTAYMAPEQYSGNPSRASDLYALGVVAFEMITGVQPFPGNGYIHLSSEQDAVCPRPGELRPDVPVAAGRAVLKAISFRAENRHESAGEFAEELYAGLMSDPSQEASGGLEMAHVLFMDLVGYSMLGMHQQKAAIKELQALVRGSKRHQEAERTRDIVRLPTGDGMALVFFRDPTAPARCAVELCDALRRHPHLRARMGIHSGPVFRVADINENSNVSGGGINMAQRVMDCGDAGHILVSKVVADVLAQFGEWRPYLTDLGEHSVKHGVTTHLYNLATPDAGNPEIPARLGNAPVPPVTRTERGNPPVSAPLSQVTGQARRIGMFAAPALVLLLGMGFLVWKFAGGPGPAAAVTQTRLGYSLTVQRPETGSEQAHLAHETALGTNAAVSIDFDTVQAGHLYVLAEGTDTERGAPKMDLLYPRREDVSRLEAGSAVRVPPDKSTWLTNSPAGRKAIHVVWSASPVQELENARNAAGEAGGSIRMAAAYDAIRELAASRNHGAGAAASTEEQRTVLQSSGDPLAYTIELDWTVGADARR
ncbi:MAG: protein kinase [Bryobacteraceae bacterium]